MHTGLESVRFGAGGWVSLLDDKVMMKDELQNCLYDELENVNDEVHEIWGDAWKESGTEKFQTRLCQIRGEG